MNSLNFIIFCVIKLTISVCFIILIGLKTSSKSENKIETTDNINKVTVIDYDQILNKNLVKTSFHHALLISNVTCNGIEITNLPTPNLISSYQKHLENIIPQSNNHHIRLGLSSHGKPISNMGQSHW